MANTAKKTLSFKDVLKKPVEKLTNGFIKTFGGTGRFFVFLGRVLSCMFRRPFRLQLCFEQMELIGVRSIPIISISGMAIGMIFALQITALMRIFNAENLVGAAVGMTLAREMAPVVTTLMLIAKNGSAMTAELGTMRVTEQIDAMETMSVDPIHYLVIPRLAASVVVFPILTALANVVGIIGAYLVAVFFMSVDPAGFLDRLYAVVNPRDVLSGMIKAVVMAFMMTNICCYFGFYSDRGAKGVGEAATSAVVTSSIGILIADYILADLMIKVLYQSSGALVQ